MFGVPVKAHGEETSDFAAPGDESTIKWYIDQDGVDRIKDGMVCSSCLEPFPAPPNIANTKIWREHSHHYSRLRTEDELLSLVARNACPICRTEVSVEMFALTHKGRDPHEPEKIEIPE
jgi:hypothetical protein